jgi:Methyltransferase domain
VHLAGRIAALDTSLFDSIETETTPQDRRSLLALHEACAQHYGSFSYLEIGSHLGGSLQVLIRDERCQRIVSIDARPSSQPDERGHDWPYPDNTTARMRSLLASVPGASLGKLETIDASTETLDSEALGMRPALCFIDGEHTDDAVVRDARFCHRALGGRGWIAFHDCGIVYRGVRSFLEELADSGVEHRTYFLPDTIIVLELGEKRLAETPQVLEQILANAQGYLRTLHDNDKYREALRRRGVLSLLVVGSAIYERARRLVPGRSSARFP